MVAFSAIVNFTNEVDPSHIRVVASPRIVWVFGGPFDVKASQAFQSNRSVFLDEVVVKKRHALSEVIRIPEDYKEWNSFDGYPDLLQFERDAGYLANAVIIFSESPGSLAELGAFAADEILCAKTLVVISKTHRDKDSYITYGPLRKLERADEHSVCVVEADSPHEFAAELHLAIAAAEAKFRRAPKSSTFEPSNVRDLFLLIADFVDLFFAVTRSELLGLLEFAGVKPDKDRVRQLVRQLLLFNLIEEHQVGHVTYLTPTKASETYIDYQARQGLPSFDRMNFKTACIEIVKGDATRIKAYLQSKKRGSA